VLTRALDDKVFHADTIARLNKNKKARIMKAPAVNAVTGNGTACRWTGGICGERSGDRA
jgi:hypothetical protein